MKANHVSGGFASLKPDQCGCWQIHSDILQLVWRSRLKACLKVSSHIRVSGHEGGFLWLIRIKTGEQGSRVTVMRLENWRHFSGQRVTAVLFRPHCSEAFTRDLVMTNHLLEMSPNGHRRLFPVTESNLKPAPRLIAAAAAVAAAASATLDMELKQQVTIR